MKTMIQVGVVVSLAVCLLAVGDAWARGGRWRWRRWRRWRWHVAGWWWHEPPESVGEPFAVGQSCGAVRQPALDARGQSSQRRHSSQHRRSSQHGHSSQRRHASQHGRSSQHGHAARARGRDPRQGDLQNFLDMPKPSTGAIGGAGAGTRPGGSNLGAAVGAGAAGGAAAEFLQNGGAAGRPAAGQLPAGGNRAAAGRVENRADRGGKSHGSGRDSHGSGVATVAGQSARPDREPPGVARQSRRAARRSSRSGPRNHPIRDFWSEYPGWAALRITRPYRWATWGAITGWVGYGWSEPTSYSYGDNVYYEGDSVYYGDQVVASAEEYTQQAEEIAASAPEVAPDKAEWMPLGVFALTPDGQASGPDPTLFLQLAISKEGIISGTLNNTATDKTQTIEGMADKTVAALRLDRGRPDSADHGNGHQQSDRGHRTGAGAFRRRPDPAMADGAAGGACRPKIETS